jgi:uncharacterized membrane protein (DUF485 family)
MLHEPANTADVIDNAVGYKAKLGLKLFALYGAIYLGFILINIWRPQMMKTEVIFGMNLAIFYGFSLIIIAVVMGVIYNHCCTRRENALNRGEDAL